MWYLDCYGAKITKICGINWFRLHQSKSRWKSHGYPTRWRAIPHLCFYKCKYKRSVYRSSQDYIYFCPFILVSRFVKPNVIYLRKHSHSSDTASIFSKASPVISYLDTLKIWSDRHDAKHKHLVWWLVVGKINSRYSKIRVFWGMRFLDFKVLDLSTPTFIKISYSLKILSMSRANFKWKHENLKVLVVKCLKLST